jgi:hypothetical protein
MPGPRGKQRAAKKPKPTRSTTSTGINPQTTTFEPLIDDIDGAEDWNAVARLLCDYLELPGMSNNFSLPSKTLTLGPLSDLTKRSGLKKVYNNFDVIYKRTNDLFIVNAGNVKIAGGIIAIYTKMCADAILRNLLFQKGHNPFRDTRARLNNWPNIKVS